MSKLKAKCIYRPTGLVVQFPKSGLAPMLFLEWFEQTKKAMPDLSFTVKTEDNTDDPLENFFAVKLVGAKLTLYSDCVDYLNQ